MGKKAWDGKGDLKVSDYVVYQWDDKGKYHQSDRPRPEELCPFDLRIVT